MPGVIAYNNLLRSATISAEATVTNYPIANALDGRTATQAGTTTGASQDIDFDLGSAQAVDTFAMARHNLGSNGSDVVLYGSNSAIFSPAELLLSWNPTTDDVYINQSLAPTTNYRYFKLRTQNGTGTNYFGDVFLGESLVLERSQKGGFIKPEFADGDEVVANLTRGQNLAGLTVTQGPKRVKFELHHYSASFFSTWADLTAVMKTYPIYIRWQTSAQPFYCWPAKSIPEPKYSKNIVGYYEVVLDMMGITQ